MMLRELYSFTWGQWLEAIQMMFLEGSVGEKDFKAMCDKSLICYSLGFNWNNYVRIFWFLFYSSAVAKMNQNVAVVAGIISF